MSAALSPFSSSDVSGPDHLRVDGVSRSFPDRRVLTDISFTVSSGERACLIGENGAGKSTLLRIVAGADRPDSGAVSAPGVVGLFHQQPPFALDRTIGEVLTDAAAPLRTLTQQVELEAEAMTGAPTNSRAGRSRACRWPGCSSAAPTRCCSTSRPTTWTTGPPPWWPNCCSGGRARC